LVPKFSGGRQDIKKESERGFTSRGEAFSYEKYKALALEKENRRLAVFIFQRCSEYGFEFAFDLFEIDGRGAFHAETVANARLIAAAPALVEALEVALPVLESLDAREEGEEESGLVTQCRAALLSARGQP